MSPGSDPAERPTRPAPGRPYRTPRYTMFLGTGAVVGLVVGVALALYGGGDTVTTERGVLGYFSAVGIVLGGLVGGSLAVVVESVTNRAARRRRR